MLISCSSDVQSVLSAQIFKTHRSESETVDMPCQRIAVIIHKQTSESKKFSHHGGNNNNKKKHGYRQKLKRKSNGEKTKKKKQRMRRRSRKSKGHGATHGRKQKINNRGGTDQHGGEGNISLIAVNSIAAQNTSRNERASSALQIPARHSVSQRPERAVLCPSPQLSQWQVRWAVEAVHSDLP